MDSLKLAKVANALEALGSEFQPKTSSLKTLLVQDNLKPEEAHRAPEGSEFNLEASKSSCEVLECLLLFSSLSSDTYFRSSALSAPPASPLIILWLISSEQHCSHL